MLTSACRVSNSVTSMTKAAIANATVSRFSVYTAEEQEVAIAANLAYAPVFGPLRTVPAANNLQVNAFNAVYGDIEATNASKPWDHVTTAVGLAPESGVRPRMAPHPTTGLMAVLPIGNAVVNVTDAPTSNARVFNQQPKWLFESVNGAISRAKRGLAAETPLVIATASLSTSTLAAAGQPVDNYTPAEKTAMNVLGVHASTSTPTVTTPLAVKSASTALIGKNMSLDATRYDFMPRELRTLSIENCTPLWRTLFLNQHDSDLTYIAYNGGAHA